MRACCSLLSSAPPLPLADKVVVSTWMMIEVVFASRSMVNLVGRSRAFIPFCLYRVLHAPQNDRWCYGSLSSSVLDSI